jgi:hypothetical protein
MRRAWAGHCNAHRAHSALEEHIRRNSCHTDSGPLGHDFTRELVLCRRLAVRRGLPTRLASPFGLPEHPDEHRPKRPVLLAVDQELGEGTALRVAPELSDPVGAVEVAGSIRTWREFGARRDRGIEALTELALDLLQVPEKER